jgi:DnaK suppressor protein
MKNKLDKKKILIYQNGLLDLKEKIIKEIKQISDHAAPSEQSDSGDVSGHAMHIADVATDMYDREFSLGLAANDRELLNKIDKALKRIQEGSYGLCCQCGCPIRDIRLKALPYVENCLKCQEKLEA